MIKVNKSSHFIGHHYVVSINITLCGTARPWRPWTIARANLRGEHGYETPTGSTELVYGRRQRASFYSWSRAGDIDQITDFLQWIEAAKESREIGNEIQMTGAPKTLKPRRL